jgi:hypothetical protein
MTDIVDLNAERNKREQPDPEFIRKDEYGRPLYCFIGSYEHDGKRFGGVEVWAYDAEEAQARFVSMRETAEYDGQLFSVVPA